MTENLSQHATKTDMESNDIFLRSNSIREICASYRDAFERLSKCPAPRDVDSEAYFAQMVEKICSAQATYAIDMAKGAFELRDQLSHDKLTFFQRR